jgi:hypothetical protein
VATINFCLKNRVRIAPLRVAAGELVVASEAAALEAAALHLNLIRPLERGGMKGLATEAPAPSPGSSLPGHLEATYGRVTGLFAGGPSGFPRARGNDFANGPAHSFWRGRLANLPDGRRTGG